MHAAQSGKKVQDVVREALEFHLTEAKPCRRCKKAVSECGYTVNAIRVHDWICQTCIAKRNAEAK